MARGKVLVVDDSETERTHIVTTLKRDGYTVSAANSADEATAKLRQELPDVMLLDVIMPGVNGFQFCRSLRRDPRYAKLPIVMVTSKNQETDREWGLKQGASEYLTKPFTPEQLAAAVRRYA
jgi:twitching motility two-component system response regulator PilH